MEISHYEKIIDPPTQVYGKQHVIVGSGLVNEGTIVSKEGDSMHNMLRIIVTVGLVTGYFILTWDAISNKSARQFIGNAILLPASIIWLWLLRGTSQNT